MKARKKARGLFTWCSLFAATFSALVLPAGAQQPAVQRPPTIAEDVVQLPDSPGATVSKSDSVASQEPTAQLWTVAALPTELMQSQSAGTQPQTTPPQKPVGTAVSEAPNAGGVAASQPAGVAIAPAKQRRVRTIMLRMGAIVGAGVAVGSVVALTAATPSKPPGAH